MGRARGWRTWGGRCSPGGGPRAAPCSRGARGPARAPLGEPMLAGMTTTRQHLLAWVHAHGLAALDAVFRDEAMVLAGAKGRHQAQRTHYHWGPAPTELPVIFQEHPPSEP